MEIIAFNTIDTANRELAEKLFVKVKKLSLHEKGIIIAVSGGSTPFEMYKILSEKLTTINTPIHIIQVDERFVPKSSGRSNQNQIAPIFDEFSFHGMVTPDEIEDLDKAVEVTWLRYQKLFDDLNKSAPDVTILGMGSDGHTASLFPNNDRYLESRSDGPGIIGMFVESQDENRISLNKSLINLSKYKILYAHGEDKLQTLNSALETRDEKEYPIMSVIKDTILITVKSDNLWKLADKWKIESL